ALGQVYRFFMERHAGHFNIVNLVAERDYNLEICVTGAVARYPFSDHNPPAMEMLLPCCAHIHSFLQAKGENVVAIHCKAGKGRTGYPLHPTPYTLHHTPYTLHPTPYTLHPTPYTPHPAPCTLHPTPCTLHPTLCTLHPTPHTPHPRPSTMNPEP
ncbi:hypothetical protein T484DRAFT_1614424, partial [Baffinella frigidus]